MPASPAIAALLLSITYRSPSGVVGVLADPIDITTGDYLSIERGFDPTDAAFLTAMRTVRGSGSAVQSVGQRFEDHGHVDPELAPFMREEVRLAAKEIVDRGDLRIEKVTVAAEGNAAETYVEWFNVARDKARGPLAVGAR